MTNPSRRTITRGAAWSVPAVMTAAAAPASAVSPTGVELTRYTQYYAQTSGCANGYKLHWDGTQPGVNGVTIKNSRSTPVTVSNLSIVFLVSVNNLALKADSGYTGWSSPTATGATQTINGIRYYQYRSAYTGTTTVPAKGTSYVQYSFTGSICRTGTTYITGGQAFATIDAGTAIQSLASTVQTTCTTGDCR